MEKDTKFELMRQRSFSAEYPQRRISEHDFPSPNIDVNCDRRRRTQSFGTRRFQHESSKSRDRIFETDEMPKNASGLPTVFVMISTIFLTIYNSVLDRMRFIKQHFKEQYLCYNRYLEWSFYSYLQQKSAESRNNNDDGAVNFAALNSMLKPNEYLRSTPRPTWPQVAQDGTW